MDVSYFKILATCVILVIGVVFTILPIFVHKYNWMSKMDSLSCGVFFGAAFIHLYPESMHFLSERFTFPLYGYLALSGLFIMIAVDTFTSFSHNHGEHSTEKKGTINTSIHPTNSIPIEAEQHNCDHDESSSSISSSSSFNEINDIEGNQTTGPIMDNNEVCKCPDCEAISNQCQKPGLLSSSQFGSGTIHLRCKALYGVLAFHAAIEAISLGVSDSFSTALSLFFALIGHKPVEVFTLGLQLINCHPSKCKYFVSMGIFSLIAPLAIVAFMLIGIAANDIFAGVITSLSSGIFVYIAVHTLIDTLHHISELSTKEKIYHLTALFVGLLWMSLMGLMHTHDHSHGGDDHDHDH